MKNTLTVRQICFILFAYNAVLKLIEYPAVASVASGADIVFPALFDFALNTIVIWSVAYMCSRTDKTFFELLCNTFGKVFARIVMGLFALYFLLSAIIPMNEQQLLIHSAFYDTVPSIYVFLPFFFFSVYAGAKGFANAGRCADICLPIFAVAISAMLVMSVGQGDYSNLLPILKQPFSKIAGSSLSALFRFSEGALLLMFMGHFKYKKGDATRLTLSYVAGGVVVIAFLAIFYAVYGAMAPSRPFLFNDISVFFPAIQYVGRVDLVLFYALDTVILFAIILYIQLSVYCLTKCFNWDKRSLLSLAVNAVLVLVTFLANNNFSALQTVAGKWFWLPTVIFAYAIPLCGWALKRRER